MGVHKATKSVFECISLIIGKEIPLQAKLCLLEIYPQDSAATLQHLLLIEFGLLQARGIITLLWKNLDVPSIGM